MSVQKNEVVYGKSFLKDVRKLSNNTQEKLADMMEIIVADPFDSRLHTKPLGPPLQGIFSFRITRDYRVGFKFKTVQCIELLAVDNRDAIYQKLRRQSGR